MEILLKYLRQCCDEYITIKSPFHVYDPDVSKVSFTRVIVCLIVTAQENIIFCAFM